MQFLRSSLSTSCVVASGLVLAPGVLFAQAQVPLAEAVTAPVAAVASHRIYSGRANETAAVPQRIDQPRAIKIDGYLNEPAWAEAALLTGFSEYTPTDGLPAEDSTEVLVWYSETVVYFGIRAWEPHGPVRARLADRDRIGHDDYVALVLDTFNDHRRAIVLGVNPLGGQGDGTRTDGQGSGVGGGDALLAVNQSEDFVFQSKGRLTDYGYEVEIRVPLKSIRFQTAEVQDWGFNVVRMVQHSGHQQTWTRVRRGAAGFLPQSGTLHGFTHIKRGLVLDLNPVTTAHVDGAPSATGWDYGSTNPEVGGNVRWGVNANLTLNATGNPDFSQVESDVAQVQFDPRSALSYPEKRPFFVEGTEQFDAPASLIYTRAITQPVAAAKLNGKAFNTNVGFLSAVDQRPKSATPVDNPVFNILRLKRDIGRQSTLGLLYTDWFQGGNYNRVAGLDARIVFKRLYALSGNYDQSFDHTAGVSRSAPIWRMALDRTGRRFGINYAVEGFNPAFHTSSGFSRRLDIVNASFNHKFTWFGKPKAHVENYQLAISVSGNWNYDNFFKAGSPNDPKLHFSNTITLHGGWKLNGNIFFESFRYDPALYATYFIERTLASGAKDTVPYTGVPRLPNVDYVVGFTTPQWKTFNGSFNVTGGKDENFFEWSSGNIVILTAVADWRPTEKVRVNARYPLTLYQRMSDLSTVSRVQIPRLKVEYQATRAIFFRFVGQYNARFQDALRDDGRTNFPILLRSSKGTFSRATAIRTNNFRMDWLFSWQPNPGTVFYVGYGSSYTEAEAFRFNEMQRVSDGFFTKLSYLYRL